MDKKFDNRTLQLQLRRGVISHKEVEEYLASLPDDADEGVETETRYSDSASRGEAAER